MRWALILVAAGLTAAEPPADARASFLAALMQSPAVGAAQERVLAAERAVGAAGVLPDPMLGGELGRKRPEQGDDMRMYGVMLEQPLPRWGERDAERAMARAGVGAARADHAQALGEHAAEVAAMLAEAAAAAQEGELLTAAHARVVALQAVVRARVASGGASLGEALALETRAEQLAVDIADRERMRRDAEAEARGRLALAVDAALPPPAWPDPAAIDAAATPMAHRAAAMRDEALAQERAARARGNPETAVGVGWEREAAGTDMQEDTVTLNLRVSLPVWRAAYADGAGAARRRARAAAHEAHAAAAMAQSRLDRARRAIAQAERAAIAAAAIAARADADYDALLRQVSTGGADALRALDILDRVTEARLAAVVAARASRLALAELWRLAPPQLGTTP
jgi:outer membrane protein TolC